MSSCDSFFWFYFIFSVWFLLCCSSVPSFVGPLGLGSWSLFSLWMDGPLIVASFGVLGGWEGEWDGERVQKRSRWASFMFALVALCPLCASRSAVAPLLVGLLRNFPFYDHHRRLAEGINPPPPSTFPLPTYPSLFIIYLFHAKGNQQSLRRLGNTWEGGGTERNILASVAVFSKNEMGEREGKGKKVAWSFFFCVQLPTSTSPPTYFAIAILEIGKARYTTAYSCHIMSCHASKRP